MPAGRYQAESPSLFDNPGGPLAPRYNVDIPGAINALANGTGSVIHNIYARKMALRQQQIETDRNTQQAQWHQDEIERQRQHDTIEQQRYEREQHLREVTAGVTPASTSTTVTSGDENPVALAPMTAAAASGTPAGATPIAAAMGAPKAPAAVPFDPSGQTASPLPPMAQTPSAPSSAPVTFQAPQPSVQTTTTPESYDPTKSMGYVKQVEAANITANSRRDVANTGADARRDVAASNLEGRKVMAAAAKYAADKRASTKGKGITGALTGNALESKFERVDAPGLLAASGYDLPKAIDVLQSTPEGQALAAQGFSARHLAAAYEKHIAGLTGQATRLQSGALGLTPEESTGAVTKTEKLVRGSAARTAPAPAAPGAPATPAPAATGKQLTAKPAADAEPTDDELRQALAAGVKPTDAAGARAWVKKHRQKGAK